MGENQRAPSLKEICKRYPGDNWLELDEVMGITNNHHMETAEARRQDEARMQMAEYAAKDAVNTYNLRNNIVAANRKMFMQKVWDILANVAVCLQVIALLWILLSIFDVNAHNTITTSGSARAWWNFFDLLIKVVGAY